MVSRTVWIATFVVAATATSAAPARAEPFFRGDAGGDDRRVSRRDAVQILAFLFNKGESQVQGCKDAADVNDDGTVSVSDVVFLLQFLYRGGPPPGSPHPDCGDDPTPDDLGCSRRQFRCVPPATGGQFWVVPRPGSPSELKKSKNVVTLQILNLAEDAFFGLVFFDCDVVLFPADGVPAPATQENRDAALAVVSVITPSEGNCLSRGVVAALEFVGRSSAKENTITALVASSRCDETCQPDCPDVTEELLDDTLRGIATEPRLNGVVVTPQSCAEAERALEELVERFGGEIGHIRN